ncbi:MAG TPA: glycosyltransferase family 2 protein [Candidatus Methanoperedens sp.]|nr:glycosyltransferase family 2 protein [Candidatus Methanoperedens sp.]
MTIKTPRYKKISIVIPCFNESKTIDRLISKVRKSDTLGLKKEIIVVDDGSTDGSDILLRKYIKNKIFKILFLKNNFGKGYALKMAFSKTTGDVVVIQDADLEYDPVDYVKLIKPILNNMADVVYGSRFIGGESHRVLYYWHSVFNKLLTCISNAFTNINLTDLETGYKVFRGDLIRRVSLKLESDRFGFEPEVTARLSKIKNIRFYEVGISYNGRTYKEGKHIGFVDGLLSLFQIIKYNIFR